LIVVDITLTLVRATVMSSLMLRVALSCAACIDLGDWVLSATEILQTPIVIMGIVVIAAIAHASDHLVRWIERRVVSWKGRG
jgi:ABC-type nitrate/sulfonate/bicarbonate transport system permease component